jgi:hypothetical protein
MQQFAGPHPFSDGLRLPFVAAPRRHVEAILRAVVNIVIRPASTSCSALPHHTHATACVLLPHTLPAAWTALMQPSPCRWVLIWCALSGSPCPVDVGLVESPLVGAEGAELHGKGAPLQHRHPEQRDRAHQAVCQPCSATIHTASPSACLQPLLVMSAVPPMLPPCQQWHAGYADCSDQALHACATSFSQQACGKDVSWYKVGTTPTAAHHSGHGPADSAAPLCPRECCCAAAHTRAARRRRRSAAVCGALRWGVTP